MSQRGVQPNSDGSYDIYFGPKAPVGKENNWIQTMPDKGWNVVLRFYGPPESWLIKCGDRAKLNPCIKGGL